MKESIEPVIVIDSREQHPYVFTYPTVVKGLPAGDYSILGLENRISIERKSLPDLLQSLTRGRERFEKELSKARAYDQFFVIVECSPSTILEGRFSDISRASPIAIWESVCTFSVRHCPFLFAENRQVAERMVESILLKYSREFVKVAKEVARAAQQHRLSV